MAEVPDDYDQYTMYRFLYHLDKFTYGWRNLLIFYLAMFIAGYAQVLNSWVFWGSWGTLVLIYWEPYLSPPYPWSSDSISEDSFNSGNVQPWGQRPPWLRPAREGVKRGMRQWLFAVRQGLLKQQRRVHRSLQDLIAVPCICLAIGVVQQDQTDLKAMYSAVFLLALVLVYTAVTLVAYLLFRFGATPRLSETYTSTAEPKDMMFFICKILGQTLNTTVQTLVAGSFVEYMPTHLFWLAIAITGMSYCATNLLYDMGPGPPVEEDEALGGLWERWSRRRREPKSSSRQPSAADSSFEVDMDDCRTTSDTCAKDPTRCSVHLDRQLAMKKAPPPPFLSYKWPKGERGWAIIALLIGVSAPSLAVLIMLVRGIQQDRPELYFAAEPDSCPDICFLRYRQMLFMLCCLGFFTSYYAFTVGFMGSGPTTWLYKNVYLRWFSTVA